MPVIAIAGSIGQDAGVNIDHGIDAFTTILEMPCKLTEAIAQAPMLVTNATERMMRMVILGFSLPRSYRGLLHLQQDDRGAAISQLSR